jgi:S1-C subfamily serine protease
VLRLQVEGDSGSGTGYLIDSSRGYIVTAFHVVHAALPDTPIKVRFPSSAFASQTFTAKLVRSLGHLQQDGTVAGTDLALLQLQPGDSLSTVRPVDISLQYPGQDTLLYSLGFPQLGDLGNEDITTQLTQLIATPEDGSIEVRQAIFGGNSGGPLLDASGSSVGTCRETVGTGLLSGAMSPWQTQRHFLT